MQFKGELNMTTDVQLRAIEKTDMDFLHKLYNDPSIMQFWFEEAHYSMAKLEESFEKQEEADRSRGFILQKGEEKLGFVALFHIEPVHRKAEFAIMMDPEQQGKGYAKTATTLAMDYAFRTLNLHKLYLIVDVENKKAVHIYEKMGYSHEATLTDEFFINGAYHSIAYMSLFQKDYLEK